MYRLETKINDRWRRCIYRHEPTIAFLNGRHYLYNDDGSLGWEVRGNVEEVGYYGLVPALEVRKSYDKHVAAVRSGDMDAAQETLDEFEQFASFLFQSFVVT